MSSNQDLTSVDISTHSSALITSSRKHPLGDDSSDDDDHKDGDDNAIDDNLDNSDIDDDDDEASNGPPLKKQKQTATEKKQPPQKAFPKPLTIACSVRAATQPPRVIPLAQESVYPTSTGQAAAGSGMVLFDGRMAPDLATSWSVNTSQYFQARDYVADARLKPANPKKVIGSSVRRTSLEPNLPPIHNIDRIFDIIAQKAMEKGFLEAYKPLLKQGLRLVTMCSGTESPVLAMRQLANSLERKSSPSLHIDHLASAEIVPFKQAYIQRNFEPNILFRDVTEFSKNQKYAHTAFGGLVEQPAHVHMLIAGSSCVDYSSLNVATKQWGEQGESYHTMMGVFDYAKRFQPAIVILENVEKAPWQQVCELWYSGGYHPVAMHVDSKDFYIPQTRSRGYLVAFNIERAKKIGLNLEKAKMILVDTMRHLSQRASSPYTDFLYKDDDPELKLSKQVLSMSIDADRSGRDWEACRIRYNGFRVEHGLGNARPLTLWKNGGKSQVSDYIWMEWAAAQRERILDTLDINYLACAADRHYDMTSKSRIMELSQNVDRDQDTRHWGIISCITPSGMPWDTLRGGPISGREALALQGIPVNNLSLNEESSRQLQDLAGNAMTSTVVGCVVISAIVASHVDVVAKNPSSETTNLSMFEHFDAVATSDQVNPSRSSQNMYSSHLRGIEDEFYDGPLHSRQIDLCQSSPDISRLRDMSTNSLLLCKCDDLLDSSSQRVYRCRLCGHTACNRCAGNPRHKYEDVTASVHSSRVNPNDFISEITRALPPVLTMHASQNTEFMIEKILRGACYSNDRESKPDIVKQKTLHATHFDRYKSAVLQALHSTLYFQSVKQGSMWRVTYESADARLELRFFPVLPGTTPQTSQLQQHSICCVWLLYALPDPDESSVSIVRDLLSRPIARMEPSGRSFLDGNWQFWDPSMPYAYIDIRGMGQPQASWEQKLGLQREVFRTLNVFPKLKVTPSQLSNALLNSKATQVLNDLCGDFEILADCGTACGYLHRRASPTVNQNQPAYLFLESKPLQNGYLDRMTFAHTHIRVPQGVNRPVVAELAKAWRPNSLTIKGSSLIAQKVPCRLVDCWHDNLEISLTNGITQQEQTVWTLKDDSVSIGDCRSTLPIVVSKLHTEKIPQEQWSTGKHYTVDLVDCPGAIKDFQYVLKRLNLSNIYPGGEIALQGLGTDCSTCAPEAPGLKWCCTRAKSKKKIEAVVRPFEDAEEATKHEKLLRDRPAPVTAEIYAENGHAWLVVLINPTTVVHRLCSKLQLNNSTGKAEWHFVQNSEFSNLPVFKKPEIGRSSSTEMWPAGDPLYADNPLARRPRRFGPRDLWEGQRKALAWMLTVEDGVSWLEWDAEIFDMPALNQQFHVEAKIEVSVRGGIVADKVGGGKTTTTIALTARGLEKFPTTHYIPPAIGTGRIRSRATLILVPQNILGQWQAEIEACFRDPRPSVVIVNGNSFSESIRQIKFADIVLVSWGIFSQNAYWRMLSRFCCAPNKPDKPGRAFNQWIEETIIDIEDIVTNCGADMDPKVFHAHRKSHKEEKKRKYTAFGVFATDKDVAQRKKRQEDALKQLATGIHNPDAAGDDTELIDAEFDRVFAWKKSEKLPALLHLFEFERIIVDEFTYLDAQALVAIQKLKAKYRWMLSGTPPISNPESINAMATLVGARISAETQNKYAFSFKDARTVGSNEKSYEEEFRERIQKRSLAWTLKRNERCSLFVDSFIRRNSAPPSTVREIVEFVVVPQSPLEAYIYNKTFQRITGQPLRFGVTNAKQAGQSKEEKQLGKLQEAKSPEEAFLTCHALFIEDYLRDYADLSNKEICDALTKETRDAVRGQLSTIRNELKEAYWYWYDGQAGRDTALTNSHLITYLDCILNGTFGDPTASNLLSWTTAEARQNRIMPSVMMSGKSETNYDQSAEHTLKTRVAEMQKRATELNNKTLSFVYQIQQLRLLTNVSSLLSSGDKMECEGCTEAVHTTELTMLAHCGHLVCKDCLKKHSKSWDIDSCPVEGCTAATKDCRIPASTYTTQSSSATTVFGSKIDAVVAKIKAVDEKERILIFIQFDAHKHQLIRALDFHLIKYEDGTKQSETTISDFQRGEDRSKRVLLLRADSVDSAGWNLQIANHVMFIHPYLSRSQYDYEATMTQAVGRALRFGQQKDVHVYYFISTITQDVNILQSRTGKKLVKSSGDRYTLMEVNHEDARAQEDLSGPSLDQCEVIGEDGGEAQT